MLWLGGSSSVAQKEDEQPQLELWQHRGIMAAMTDPDPLVWGEALDKLAEFNLETLTDDTEIPKNVYQQMTEILDANGYRPATRAAAARTLGAMGEAAAAHAPQLMALLADPKTNFNVRTAAASALGAMGKAAAAQVPQLMALLADPKTNFNVRVEAARALGAIGEAAAAQAPQLMALLADPETDRDVRTAAYRA
ncbi:MAG: HEAT repeat domain-containing protein [Cyanobacteria bacterium J06626_4]